MITLHNGKETIELLVNDNSYSYEAIMGEDTLTLYFSHPGFINIPVGAWCEFYGKRYSLKKDSNFKKNGERNYEYTLVLETSKADTQLWKVRNMADNRIKFSYTAKPKEHLQLLVDNLNRRSAYKWKVGECIEGVEKTVNYNHTYVLDGINQVASAYETEWQFIEEVKEEVHDGMAVKVPQVSICLRKVEYNKENPLKLSYGKGHGFKTGVGREAGEVPPEIILVETTDRNIDYSKYGAKELLLPKNQTIRFDGEHFEGETGFDASAARSYKTDEYGTTVMRADRELVTAKEDSLDCTGIYPSRVGTVSGVVLVDAKNHFYDFIDQDIPEALDFEKCLIVGENMTVIFQTGMLAGREFEVKYYHEPKDGKKSRRFELVPQEIDGIMMLGGDVWVPKVGDKYAVFGIQLPEAYICDNATKTGASWDVFKEAAKYLYEHEDKKFTFTGTLDGIWAKKRWLEVGGKIVLGGFVNFSDTQFHPGGSLIRMTGIKRYVNNPYSPEIELSNAPVGTSIISNLNKIETNEVVVDDKHKEALQFTKRRFRDARETMDMLAASLLNYASAVNPITVATMQMLVGDESLQFRFVSSKTNPAAVSHDISYDASAKVLHAPAGILQHMTLGIKELSSTYAGRYQFWDMAEYISPSLVEPEKKFYLYAKCSRADQSGTFLLSETAIGMEQIEGYYHFLVGVLNSENDGDRSYASLYGFTEVLPGRITTDKIVSKDGKTYFDLDGGEIGGHIVFTSTDGSTKTLPELEASAAQDATNKSDAAKQEAMEDAAKKYDNTKTTINGGLVTSGTIQLAGDGDIKAGITGQGTSDDSVRIWTGATFNNRANAPFRVLQNGKMFAVDGTFSGEVTSRTGLIGGFKISGDSLVNEGLSLHKTGIKFFGDNVYAGLGMNSIDDLGGLDVPLYVKNHSRQDTNVACVLSAKGASKEYGNIALQVNSGRVDIPGVLKGMLINVVNTTYTVTYKYGDWSKGFNIKNYDGTILVTHYLGHSRYFVVGNAYGGFARSVSFQDITDNSFRIKIFDTQGNNELWTPVSFVMIGDNR